MKSKTRRCFSFLSENQNSKKLQLIKWKPKCKKANHKNCWNKSKVNNNIFKTIFETNKHRIFYELNLKTLRAYFVSLVNTQTQWQLIDALPIHCNCKIMSFCIHHHIHPAFFIPSKKTSKRTFSCKYALANTKNTTHLGHIIIRILQFFWEHSSRNCVTIILHTQANHNEHCDQSTTNYSTQWKLKKTRENN